jgi:hypothetical protein
MDKASIQCTDTNKATKGYVLMFIMVDMLCINGIIQ